VSSPPDARVTEHRSDECQAQLLIQPWIEILLCRGSLFIVRVQRRSLSPTAFEPTTKRFCNGLSGRERAPPRSFGMTIRPARRTSTSPPHSRRLSRSWLSFTAPVFAHPPSAKSDSHCWSDRSARWSYWRTK